MTNSPTQRPLSQLKIAIEQAARSFVKVWPLQTFIACNPLLHYEKYPFFDALQKAEGDLCWQNPFKPEAFQAWHHHQHIDVGILRRQFEHYLRRQQTVPEIRFGPQRLPLTEFLWADLIATLSTEPFFKTHLTEMQTAIIDLLRTDLPGSAAAHARPIPAILPDKTATLSNETLSDGISRLTGAPIPAWIDELMVKWCAAFLDQGQALWPMPHREQGLLKAWRRLACHDSHLNRKITMRLKAILKNLPENSYEAVDALLNRIGIPEEETKQYLRMHFARLPGWVGYMRWFAEQREYSALLADYLAIRLCYELAFCSIYSRARLGCESDMRTIRQFEEPLSEDNAEEALQQQAAAWAQRLLRLAGALHVSALEMPKIFRQPDAKEYAIEVLHALAGFDLAQKGRIVLETMEMAYQQTLLTKLAENIHQGSGTYRALNTPLLAQAVFCIDVRSEPFRHCLESTGAIETFGFAGFFGVPIRFKPLGGSHGKDLCPILLTPRYAIEETPLPAETQKAKQHLKNKAKRKWLIALLANIKKNAASTFGYVEALGLSHAVPLVFKTLLPAAFHTLKNRMIQSFEPLITVKPVLFPENAASRQSSGLAHGMTLEEQVYYSEIMLTMIGLKKGFARFVLLCGHGSQVENNPYASALDCVACGGNHGGANAHVLAEILNHPMVRLQLSARGIDIPDTTVFLAAEHNTVTDEVRIFNLYQVPPEFQTPEFQTDDPDLQMLLKSLEAAAVLNRETRASSLPSVQAGRPSERPEKLLKNAVDWSQVRPEWGTARNSAFIAAPRTLTMGMDLEGRAFLHSYDWRCDPDGTALENILTAPLIVAEWINMQYLFSALDNDRFGSGSKVVHNVVGQFGVMSGNAGDLQIGLPLQSVMIDAAQPYHIPLRLTAIVMAPVGMVEAIIRNQAMLQTLFNHEWIHLIVIEPDSGDFHHYRPGGAWQRILSDASQHAMGYLAVASGELANRY